MTGVLFIWIGLMVVGGATLVLLFLHEFPEVMVHSGKAVTAPWNGEAPIAARMVGAALFAGYVLGLAAVCLGVACLVFSRRGRECLFPAPPPVARLYPVTPMSRLYKYSPLNALQEHCFEVRQSGTCGSPDFGDLYPVQ